jgi:hypothetical protein
MAIYEASRSLQQNVYIEKVLRDHGYYCCDASEVLSHVVGYKAEKILELKGPLFRIETALRTSRISHAVPFVEKMLLGERPSNGR